MENIYVVLLVTAWVSTVTLVRTIHSTFIYHLNRRHWHHDSHCFQKQIIIVALFVASVVILPHNFAQTIYTGYKFFKEIAEGWNIGYVFLSLISSISLITSPSQLGKCTVTSHRSDAIRSRYPESLSNSDSENSVVYAISEFIQVINTLDVAALLKICPTKNMLYSIDTLVDIENFVQTAKVKN